MLGVVHLFFPIYKRLRGKGLGHARLVLTHNLDPNRVTVEECYENSTAELTPELLMAFKCVSHIKVKENVPSCFICVLLCLLFLPTVKILSF